MAKKFGDVYVIFMALMLSACGGGTSEPTKSVPTPVLPTSAPPTSLPTAIATATPQPTETTPTVDNKAELDKLHELTTGRRLSDFVEYSWTKTFSGTTGNAAFDTGIKPFDALPAADKANAAALLDDYALRSMLAFAGRYEEPAIQQGIAEIKAARAAGKPYTLTIPALDVTKVLPDLYGGPYVLGKMNTNATFDIAGKGINVIITAGDITPDPTKVPAGVAQSDVTQSQIINDEGVLTIILRELPKWANTELDPPKKTYPASVNAHTSVRGALSFAALFPAFADKVQKGLFELTGDEIDFKLQNIGKTMGNGYNTLSQGLKQIGK